MKRNHQIVTKVSSEELDEIKKKADLLGLTTSSYVRYICLKAKHELKEI